MSERTPTPPDRTGPVDSRARERVLRFQSLAEGATFAGRYEIVGPVGSGGSGEVFEAFDRTARQLVALKVLFPGAGTRDVERLRRELRVVRSLQHPGIVRLYDIGEAAGLFYIVSELLNGETLAQRLRARRRLPPDEAERILHAVLDALGHAHARGIVHRDVKPANIFLAKDDAGAERVVLLDFGLARETDAPGLTATGRFVGTPEYSAPEQIRGARELGPPTDLYAVGITLWEMLAGAPPFRGPSDVEILQAHLSHPLPSISRELPSAPGPLRALALKLLEKDPDDRPRDVAAALAELSGASRVRAAWRRARSAWARQRPGSRAAVHVVWIGLVLALGYATFVPVEVVTASNRLWWETPLGLRYAGLESKGTLQAGFVGRRVLSAAVEAVVVRQQLPSPEVSGVEGGDVASQLFRLRCDGTTEPLLNDVEASSVFLSPQYDGESPVYIPMHVARLPNRDDGFVFTADHAVNYPCRVVTISRRLPALFGVYDHPGRVSSLATVPSEAGAPPLVVAVAMNNHLGPLAVVFALRADRSNIGQAPPFLASGRSPDPSIYYTPLPFDPSFSPTLELRGREARVALAGGRVFSLDVRTGVPTHPSDRADLDPDAWAARRQAWIHAMFRAQGHLEAGRPAAGAALLERFVEEGTGGAPMLATAAYRAAILRTKAGELDLARRDARRAVELEPNLNRAHLLRVEIEIRAGSPLAARAAFADFAASTRNRWFNYDGLLAAWLIGDDPPLESAMGDLGRSGPSSSSLMIELAHAAENGDGSIAERLDVPRAEAPYWDHHHYWLARLFLDRPVPDYDRALEHLELAERAVATGMGRPPLRSLRVLARALRDGRSPTPEEIRTVEAERDDVRRWLFHGIGALAMEREWLKIRDRLRVERDRSGRTAGPRLEPRDESNTGPRTPVSFLQRGDHGGSDPDAPRGDAAAEW